MTPQQAKQLLSTVANLQVTVKQLQNVLYFHKHLGTDFSQKLAPTASLSTYGGRVSSSSSAGTPFPSGWSVTNITTGVCQITHNLGNTKYVAVATCADNNVNEFYLFNYNVDYFFVNSSIGASPVNCDFSFIVIQTP